MPLNFSCFKQHWCYRAIVVTTGFIFFMQLTGCALVDRGVPVPAHLTSQAYLSGYETIRYSVDDSRQQLVKEFASAIDKNRELNRATNMLAISGGGSDGAFGAGLLCGWTKNGNRPQFDVVTGVSTGALIAPFAFLGSAYDEQLRHAYTDIHNDDIFLVRSIFNILRGDSLTSTGPLYKTISGFIDEKLLANISLRHKQGRRLFVMTTDLDAQRPVVWNMGAIAASDHPGALELFRRIIIASASIPVIFPPQYLEVEADGEKFTEMHVDGGVFGQVFLPLPPAQLTDNDNPASTIRAYVIRNSKVSGEYTPMTPLILPILTRTFSTLVRTQGVGDLYEIYEQTKEANADYYLAYVPDDFQSDHHDMFVPEAMKKMFEYAFSMAADKQGYPWLQRPPDVL